MRGAVAAFAVLAVAYVVPAGRTPSISASPLLEPRSITITRHFTPRDQQVTRYAYVPVDVPAGTTKIAFAYRYDKAGGENVIDFGLFEPGSLALGSPAFRGWSGGAQDSISVGVDGASPGYWPGPLPAGQWHAVLGLYKVGAAGVDVNLTVTTSNEPIAGSTPSVRARSAGPLKRGAAWYVGAMHMHTLESDGALSPVQLVDKARGEKLDFVILTDHNNTTHQLSDLDRPDLLVISGEEATTPGGHFGVWGLSGPRAYVDFRVQPGDPAIAAVMQKAVDRGALISVNHPFTDCFACSWTHAVPAAVSAIEIANGTATGRQQAIAMWDALLREGRRLTAVGESDWHRGTGPIGAPASRVYAPELSTRAILDAIKAHHVIVMAASSLPPPQIVARAGSSTAGVGDELRVTPGTPVTIDVSVDPEAYRGDRVDLVWRGETLVHTPIPADGKLSFERFPPESGYFRVEIAGSDGVRRAVANPIFIVASRRSR
jgi:hypothetical protein